MSERNLDIARAIRQRDVRAVVALFFPAGPPSVGSGYRTETELWDYKSDCPWLGRENANAWAELAKDTCAFHNLKGGVVFFGVRDDSFEFCGAKQVLDSKLVNDQLRRYLGDKLWVEYHREFIQENQTYLGVLLIPPRGPSVLRFKSAAPMINGSRLFEEGDTAIREGDYSRILRGVAAEQFVGQASLPTVGETHAVDTEFYRILAPEYSTFVQRPVPGADIKRALRDPRTSVCSVIGIGGMGKTALATWATLEAYEERAFDLIVSVTAKDRELTTSGIMALEPGLGSFDILLDTIVDVIGFGDLKTAKAEVKEQEVRSLLEGSNALLFVDNLETVDDSRIIQFLDDLPRGVRALTTSRRSTVRVAVRPLDLGPMTSDEVRSFIRLLAAIPGFAYLDDLNPTEIDRIGEACDGIPLAIRWALSRASSASEALSVAESITGFGRHGEELLEFSFRRVFDSMSEAEKTVLYVLSLFQRPLQTEAIVIGGSMPQHRLLDALDALVKDALVQRLFDPAINDYAFAILPVTRAFVYSDVSRRSNYETEVRQRLMRYFEATDVSDARQRLVIRELRQGRGGQDSEAALLDLARAAERRGDLQDARQLYSQAIQRNPRSWKAARSFAEFERHKQGNVANALSLYEQAAANAPSQGKERALIFREWGMLLRDSGIPQATDLAVEKLEVALEETPNDPITRGALAHMLSRKGVWLRVVELLEPLKDHPRPGTQEKVLPLLLKAYDQTGEMLKASALRPIVDRLKQQRD